MRTDQEIKDKAQEVHDVALNKAVELFPFVGDSPQFRAYLNESLSEVPRAFDWFTERDPATFDGMQDKLRVLADHLNGGVTSRTSIVATSVADWQGNAAFSFRENFLAPIPFIEQNQVQLVTALSNALETNKQILVASRDNVYDLGDRTIAALKQLQRHSDTAAQMNLIFTVLGVLLTVAVVFVPGGAVVTTGLMAVRGLTVAGGAAQIAGAAAGYVSSAESSVQGATVNEVVSSMYEAIGKLKQAVFDAEHGLAQVLEHNVRVAEENLDTSLVPFEVPVTFDYGQFRLPRDLD